MTSHRRFREMLARRAELTAADERRLQAHLEGCPECRATAAAYEQQLRLLRSLPTLPTPPTLRSSVLQRIHTSPETAAPWYRPRPALMAPLAAAAVLALVAVAWIGTSRLAAQHGTQNASSAKSATPTAKAGDYSAGNQIPSSPLVPATGRAGTRKGASVAHPIHHPSRARNRAGASRPGSTPLTHAPARTLPSPFYGGARLTATPVSYSPGASVAAGVPTVSSHPTPIRLAATRPARRHASPPRPGASAASQAQPTLPPTSGPVVIAVGPPSTTPPPARPFAPIRGTPSPVAAVQTPIVVVTPSVIDTPVPIIPDTPTPSTIASVRAGAVTPTPTPTPTPQP